MTAAAEASRSAAAAAARVDHPPGLYVHVPFCATRCPYCDFNVVTGAGEDLRARYMAALAADLDRLAAGGPAGVAAPGACPGASWPVFGSVFVGGGTPTQVPAGDLAALLRRVRAVLPLAADAEVTVEANPEDVTADLVAELADAGVTRLSLGAQSFDPDVLGFLGRRHGPDAALAAVEAARDGGVGRVSLDLIYGAPCETDASWAATLDTAVASGVGHVSAYALTVEANTPYAADVRRGQRPAPDDDTQAERMAVAADRLAAAGFRRYELSNWARPGEESRHNLGYWRGGNWLALGAGAHGHWAAPTAGGDSSSGVDGSAVAASGSGRPGGSGSGRPGGSGSGRPGGSGSGAPAGDVASRRWWLVRSTARYTDAALAGEPTTAGEELPDEADRRTERLMMGLRLTEGVSRPAVGPVDEAEAARLVAAGLLADDGEWLALTPAGRPLAGDVIVRLLAD